MRIGRGHRRLALLAAVMAAVSAAPALHGSAGGRTPAQGARSCPPLTVPAVVGHRHRCLHAGENCSVRFRSEYWRYGFRCIAGTLRATTQARGRTA